MIRLIIFVAVIILVAPIISKHLGPNGSQIVDKAIEYSLRAVHQVISFVGELIENAIKESNQPASSGPTGWGTQPASNNTGVGNRPQWNGQK